MRKLLRNIKGGISASTVIMLSIAFLLVAILTPIAMQQIVTANQDNWNTAVKTIFATLLPILFIIGIAIRFIPRSRG